MSSAWGPYDLHGRETVDWPAIPLVRLLNDVRLDPGVGALFRSRRELARRVGQEGYKPIYRELTRSLAARELPALPLPRESSLKNVMPDANRVRLGPEAVYLWARVISASDTTFGEHPETIADRVSLQLEPSRIREAEIHARAWVAAEDFANHPESYKTPETMAAYEELVREIHARELEDVRKTKLKDPEWGAKLEQSTLKKISDALEDCDSHFREVAWHTQVQMDQYLDRPFRRISPEDLHDWMIWLPG